MCNIKIKYKFTCQLQCHRLYTLEQPPSLRISAHTVHSDEELLVLMVQPYCEKRRVFENAVVSVSVSIRG